MNSPRLILWLVAVFSLAGGLIPAHAQQKNAKASADREIAARFAPVFYQALGDKPRGNYITNFDFDGDWRGDNNWDHDVDPRFPLKAYIYFAVSETSTHYFILYAVFHGIDYKGGETKGRILSEIIGEGARRGEKYDPTGWMEEATIAHENDLEGCLLVIEKHNGLKNARVSLLETLHHNNFLLYAVDGRNGLGSFTFAGERPRLYIEPKGHGIEAYDEAKQTAHKGLLTYNFKGRAEDPEKLKDTSIGYDLLPLQTLWEKARNWSASNTTYGDSFDYGQITIALQQPNGGSAERKVKVGKIGSAFLGKVGGRNMAKPPWAWFDKDRRSEPLGHWFFDPAAAVKRDFNLDESFSTTYVRLPFWAS